MQLFEQAVKENLEAAQMSAHAFLQAQRAARPTQAPKRQYGTTLFASAPKDDRRTDGALRLQTTTAAAHTGVWQEKAPDVPREPDGRTVLDALARTARRTDRLLSVE